MPGMEILNEDSDLEDLDNMEASDNTGASGIFTIEGNPVPVPQVLDYAYRALDLDHLNLDEFLMTTTVKKKRTNRKVLHTSGTSTKLTSFWHHILCTRRTR